MYIFSVDATAKKDGDGVKAGEVYPFIVYINFKDRFGAEHLCKLYLMKAGFQDIEIRTHKALVEDWSKKSKVLGADAAMKEAVEFGYHIQLFESH